MFDFFVQSVSARTAEIAINARTNFLKMMVRLRVDDIVNNSIRKLLSHDQPMSSANQRSRISSMHAHESELKAKHKLNLTGQAGSGVG